MNKATLIYIAFNLKNYSGKTLQYLIYFSGLSAVTMSAPHAQQYQTNDEAQQWEITHLMEMSRAKAKLIFH